MSTPPVARQESSHAISTASSSPPSTSEQQTPLRNSTGGIVKPTEQHAQPILRHNSSLTSSAKAVPTGSSPSSGSVDGKSPGLLKWASGLLDRKEKANSPERNTSPARRGSSPALVLAPATAPAPAPAPVDSTPSSGAITPVASGSLSATSKGKPLRDDKKKQKDSNPWEKYATEPPLTARSYDELPADLQKLLQKSKLDKKHVDANWPVIVSILEFHLKCSFVCAKELYADEKEIQRNPNAKEQLPASHPFYVPTEKLFSDSSHMNKYTLGTELGYGGFGVVMNGICVDTKAAVAVKKVPHVTESNIRHNLAEAALMKALKHPNIAAIIDCFLVQNDMFLIMELIEGGAVTDTCRRYNFEEPEMAYVAHGMLEGIAFLHRQHVVHRDLKSANLMMTNQAEIKLIDFGLCCGMVSECKVGLVGSPFWMSPEMIRHEPYSYPTDVWSFGVTMLELANRVPPNCSNVIKAMLVTARDGCPEPFLHPKHWSSDCKDFILKALTFDARQRPSAESLQKHPFLKKAAPQKHMKKVLSSNFVDQTMEVLNIS